MVSGFVIDPSDLCELYCFIPGVVEAYQFNIKNKLIKK
jgi:hypothetical protein